MAKNSYLPNSLTSRYNLFFLLVISVSFILLLFSFQKITFYAAADEGYYLKYASYIKDKGITGFPYLFKEYIQNTQHWPFPNPLRVGYILLSALFVKFFGSSYFSLVLLSLISFYIFLAVSFYYLKKYFNERTAFFTSALLAFSPLNMAMARRPLMDAVVNLSITLSIWLFFDVIKEKKRLKTFLFVFFYALTILIKESSVSLIPFFLLYIFLQKEKGRAGVWLGAVFSPLFIALGTYIIAAGGIRPVTETIRIIINSPATNNYAILFGSGPWYRCLIDFLLLSPWVFILGIGFICHYLAGEKREGVVDYLLLLFVSIIFFSGFFTKNIRYLIFLDLPMRLFALLMLQKIATLIFKNKLLTALTALVVIISFLDYINFLDLFVCRRIYDPTSFYLLEARQVIPWK